MVLMGDTALCVVSMQMSISRAPSSNTQRCGSHPTGTTGFGDVRLIQLPLDHQDIQPEGFERAAWTVSVFVDIVTAQLPPNWHQDQPVSMSDC